MRNSKGFTLLELVIVMAIVGILAGFALVKYREISYIHEMQTDLDEIIAFFQERKLQAFTKKKAIKITVNAHSLTNDLDGNKVSMKNAYAARNAGGAISIFTIDTRGIVSPQGNIYVSTQPGTQFSCVKINSTSIREGKIYGTGCTAK